MESSVCICGAGTMGRGIALTAAMRGLKTLLYDFNPETLRTAASYMENELNQNLEKKRITLPEKENILQKISFTDSVSGTGAPFIIEAIQEKPEAKMALFLELAKINGEETIFATNTSSLSITDMAAQTPFPERITGLHFFNPANRMKLVEIIRTRFNSDTTIQRVREFAVQLGKLAVVCADTPGFIVNHVARPYYLEALRIADQQIAPMEEIDRLMESAGFKMGPFHLMDLIGNDINYSVSSSLYLALGSPERLRPSEVQEQMVKKGLLGRKSGNGFFHYIKPDSE